MLFSEREEDMYELSHVTSDEWNKNIYINLSSVFVADNNDDAINNLDRDFSNALNMKQKTLTLLPSDLMHWQNLYPGR